MPTMCCLLARSKAGLTSVIPLTRLFAKRGKGKAEEGEEKGGGKRQEEKQRRERKGGERK